jgi:orotidine-5'-phosphate decarboxylase
LKPLLAVAIDYRNRQESFDLIHKLEGKNVVLKLGLRLLPLLTPEDFKNLKSKGFKIFVDAKLHDIPSTVEGGVLTYGEMGADYITVHLSGGSKMLSAGHNAAQKTGCRILGVSVLTSLNDQDLAEIGFAKKSSAQVMQLVQLGFEAGVEGIVCSVAESLEVHQLAKQYQRSALTVTPGLKLEGELTHADQARSYTIQEAFQAHSGMLVVGRSITQAQDPAAVVDQILKSL